MIAVLDWELSTLGDPLADFSYFLMSWVTEPEGRSGVLGHTGPATGIPTIEDMTRRYCARTGRDDVPDLNWYFAFNLFRLTGIVQGIKKRIVRARPPARRRRSPRRGCTGWRPRAGSFAELAGA